MCPANGAEIRDALTTLSKRLQQWWKGQGFYGSPKVRFTDGGFCEAVFPAEPRRKGRDYDWKNGEDCRAAEAEQLEALAARGFQVFTDGDTTASALALHDNVVNRALVAAIITDHLPTAKVFETTNRVWQGTFQLREVRAMIYDLDEITRLEIVEAKGDDDAA